MVMPKDVQVNQHAPETGHSSPAPANKVMKLAKGLYAHILVPGTKGLYVIIKDFIVPIAAVAVGGLFTWAQFDISNDRQDADSVDKEIETKEQVLTDYSKVVAELMTKNKSETSSAASYEVSEEQAKMVRGQTLIALRRLDHSDEESQDAADEKSQDAADEESQDAADEKSQDREAEIESGELKGLLIRHLYELDLIHNDFYVIRGGQYVRSSILRGANIDDAILQDAWLPEVDLEGSWLRNGNFTKADLRRANLTRTDLTGAIFTDANLIGANLTGATFTAADLTRADLRFAYLNSDTLKNATLTGACYVAGTEMTYFPPGFEPDDYQMVAMPVDQSDSNTPNFQRCPPVSVVSTPEP